MRNHRRPAFFASVLALVLFVTGTAPTVDAGGAVGLHIGSGGFGVSVGFGDWGVYSRSWSDPYWSLDFNATLAGYGEWVWVEGLGRVWRPWVAASWRPYTYGRWVSTGYGMTWVSYEPWGYVPHHYGSWAFCSFGWGWVPGYSYSCANVTWVRTGGYVGWYARPPWGWSHASRGFRHGYGHGYRDGFGNGNNTGYGDGYSDGWQDARYGTYVGWRDFGAENVSRHTVSHRIASRTRLDVEARAPTNAELRQRGGGGVTETQLSRRTSRVDGREITIARPDGIARSIERNASDTVSRALSEEALERRQPLVRPRNQSESSAASSARPGMASRENRSPQSERPGGASSSPRSRQPEVSARSSFEQRPSGRTSQSRATAQVSGTGPRVNHGAASSDRGRPRSTDNSETATRMRSGSAPRASSQSRSTSNGRQAAQSPRRASESQRPQVQTRQSTTRSRQSTSTQRRASESRRSQAPTSGKKDEKKGESEPQTDRPSRARRR